MLTTNNNNRVLTLPLLHVKYMNSIHMIGQTGWNVLEIDGPNLKSGLTSQVVTQRVTVNDRFYCITIHKLSKFVGGSCMYELFVGRKC